MSIHGDLALIRTDMQQGLLPRIEEAIADVEAEIKKCKEARQKALPIQEEAFKECDAAFKKAHLDLQNLRSRFSQWNANYVAAKNNLFHSGQYHVCSFDQMRRFQLCVMIVANFGVHHGHHITGGTGSPCSHFTCHPPGSDAEFISRFFTPEMKEHSERVGLTRHADPVKYAQLLGRYK